MRLVKNQTGRVAGLVQLAAESFGETERNRLRPKLVAQFELFRDCRVATHVRVMKVVQQTATLTNHDEQSATRAVILFTGLQVFGQMVDPLGEKGNLHIGGTGVALVQFE